ncbi:hypothetical protein C8A00DRAFT_15164 [Chaetomidium leptoderma]|uniref:Uncharacterized protein n=1 Tax=Chaetomidium leptoderma TaxID=669021 RepID=A0AAN6VNS9_9PEZI|nr:hypothetical protein C8A00DRAFT_15164 [Chaetomidium leptoderma]
MNGKAYREALQRCAGPDDQPLTPTHARPSSYHFQGLDNNADDDTTRHTIDSARDDGRVLQRPSHLRTGGYTSHMRSSSRISWDGRARVPSSRTPSPSSSPPPSPSPGSPSRHQSPVRRSNRPRPSSTISLPEHSFGRPTGLPDRWSYDRERMPSPPPAPHGLRPGSPLGEHEALEVAFSRPASTFMSSPASSRPQSILLSASTDLGCSQTPSTPTLRVTIAPPACEGESSQQQRPQSKEHAYHLLSSEEMEMLSRPPPTQPPMTPSPSPGAAAVSTPKLTHEISRLGPPKQNTPPPDDSDEKKEDKPGCLGLCEIATARQFGGKFGAWFMGMVIPVTFGLVTGCVAAATGCR